MPLEKSSRVAILVSLQECGFFRPRTVHSKTNSEKPQVKIRFAFHFVERKNQEAYKKHIFKRKERNIFWNTLRK